MTRDDVLRLAREAGAIVYGPVATPGPVVDCMFTPETLERFAELVAAAERQSTAIEMERLRELAATAEKWRGIASAKHGDGRTVQEIQREAAAVAREACAKLLDSAAGRLAPAGVRTNNVDRHTADVLRRKAAAIRALGAK